jgi:hypothetical protein
MDRIPITNYPDLPLPTRLERVLNALEESRIKKGGKTKSAKKNLAKRGVKVKDPTSDLLKALGKMSPEQLARIKASYGI